MGVIIPFHYYRRRKVFITGCTIIFLFVIIFCNDKAFTYTKEYLESLKKRQSRASLGIKNSTGSGPVPVVILTYMRSGSSFCGDVLQASDDVFYLFEPLRNVQFHFRNSSAFDYLDDKKRA
nr:uncharacterized protein LOC117681315 isoform X2 [Crassostrea gigas]